MKFFKLGLEVTTCDPPSLTHTRVFCVEEDNKNFAQIFSSQCGRLLSTSFCVYVVMISSVADIACLFYYLNFTFSDIDEGGNFYKNVQTLIDRLSCQLEQTKDDISYKSMQARLFYAKNNLEMNEINGSFFLYF